MTNASEGSKQERKQASVYRTTGYILRDREISHRFSFSFLPFFQTERIPSIVITNGTIFASMPANILPFGSENSKASPEGRRRAFRFQLFVFNALSATMSLVEVGVNVSGIFARAEITTHGCE